MTGRYSMGLITLVCLVIANMIGAGVFTTSGFAMGDLGSPWRVLAAWVVGGGLAVCGALSYGGLARLLPVSGGEYLFLSRAIHPLAGFVAGWISLLAGFTGATAVAAITLEAYLWPDTLGAVLPDNVLATTAILIAALLHGFQTRHGAALQNLVVGLKLLLITGFILAALFSRGGDSWQGLAAPLAAAGEETPFSLAAFAVTLMWVSFSYSGFNAAIYVSSEVHNAHDRVPRAMVLATLIVTLIYLLLNGIFVLAPPAAAIAYQNDVAAITAQHLGGRLLADVVRVIIAIALFTSVSAMVMAGPRVYARMAEDGLLPRALRYTRAAPGAAIALQTLLAILVVWITGLRELLSYLGMTLSMSAAATVASLFVLLRRQTRERPRIAGYPWAPLIYVGFTFVFVSIAATRNPREMAAAVATILSGVAVYYLFAGARGSAEPPRS